MKDALELAVARALVAAGLEILDLSASGATVCWPGEDEVRDLQFANLRRALAGASDSDAPRILQGYLAGWTRRRETAPETERLMPRLIPPGTTASGLSAPWVEPLAEGHLLFALAQDSAASVRWVTPLDLPRLGFPLAELRRRALENLDAASEAARRAVASARGEVALDSGDGYDAARLLLLPSWAPGVRGFFVVVPSRDLLMALPVLGRADLPEALTAAVALRARAETLSRRMPYPLSPQLYWRSEGVLERIAVVHEGGVSTVHLSKIAAAAAAGEDA